MKDLIECRWINVVEMLSIAVPTRHIYGNKERASVGYRKKPISVARSFSDEFVEEQSCFSRRSFLFTSSALFTSLENHEVFGQTTDLQPPSNETKQESNHESHL